MARLMQLAMIGTVLSSSWPAAAQVTPGGASAPTMDAAANGTKVVTINTPNGAGVSNNTYTDFNVGPGGLILNNSNKITSTNLAGYIDGNRNLKTSGPASVILNQVVSTNPSTLNGYLEVAGAPAQVIVANPNGITCGGCGFINTPWATLTTGVARFAADGSIAGYDIGRGAIGITGQGLDASGERLDLFARAVSINAGIWADTINVAAGAAGVATSSASDDIVVTARKADADADAPTPKFALDVAAVGGMYARSVRLIGTEAGLGVNVDGTIASLERGFTLTSAGNIQLAGKAVATTTATVQAAGSIDVAGTLYGGQGTSVTAGGALTGAGLVASGGNLDATVGSLNSTGALVAGLNQDGSLGTAGNIMIGGPGTVRLAGQTVVPGSLSISAGTIDLASGSVQAGGATNLTAARLAQAAKGQLVAGGTLTLTTSALANGGLLQASGITLAGGTLTNDGGQLISTGSLSIGLSGAVSNMGGTIQGAGATDLTAASIGNAGGSIVNLSSADTKVSAAGDVVSQLGVIGGRGAVVISARSIDTGGKTATDQGQLIAGGALTVTATGGNIAANGGVISAGTTLSLDAAQGAVTARSGGQILSGGNASIAAPSIDLSGGTLWTGALTLRAVNLANVGGTLRASGDGDTTIVVGTIDNSGGGLIHVDGRNLTVGATALDNAGGRIEHAGPGLLTVDSANGLVNQAGTIATNGTLRLTAPTLINLKGVVSAQGAAKLAVAGALTNAGGDLDAGGPLTLEVGSVDNSAGGTIVATGGGALSLVSTGAINSRGGTIGGRGDVTISGTAIDVRGIGVLDKPGQLGGNGQLSAGGALVATAGNGGIIADDGGLIAAGGDATLTAAGAIHATGGTIDVGGVAALRGTSVDLDNGTLQAGSFAFDADSVSLRHTRLIQTGTADFTLKTAGTLDYSGTDFTSNGVNFTLSAGSLVNEGGALRHAGSGVFSLTAASLDNRNGLIATAGTLKVMAGGLDNAGGRLSAVGDAAVTVSGSLGNGAGGSSDANGRPITGTIIAGGALTLAAGAVDNQGGDIEAAGALTAKLTTLTGVGGQLKSTGPGGSLTLVAAGAVAARGGLIGSNGATDVQAGSIDIGGNGQLSAATTLNVRSSGMIQADASTISGQQVAISAPGLVIDGGTISGSTVNLELGALRNLAGTISASGAGSSRIVVAGLLRNGGLIEADGTLLTITAGSLDNIGQASGSGIRLYGGGELAISAGNLANSSSITTGGTLNLGGAGLANTGSITSIGAAGITASASLANAGTIATNAGLTLAGGAVTNGGTLSGRKGVAAALASYDGAGGRLLAGSFDDAGDASALNLATTGASSARGGTIAATGLTKLTAGTIDIGGGGVLSGRSVDASATAGDLAAIGGTIQAGTGQAGTGQGQSFVPGAVRLVASGAIDASGKGIINGSDVTLMAASLRTGSGGTLSANSLATTLGSIDNRGGTIAVTGTAPLALALSGAFENGVGGHLGVNARDLTIAAGSIDNAGGTIGHAGAGTLALSAAGDIDNGGGTIVTAGGYALTAASFINDAHGSLTAPGAGTLMLAGTLSNRGGAIGADAGLALHAGQITNGGTIGSARGAVTLTATGLDNRGGAIQGNGVAIDAGAGAVDNGAGGLLGSSGALSLKAGSLGNATGVIHAAGDATLTLASLTNGGEISAAHALSVSAEGAGGVDNNGGTLLGDTIALDAASFVNHGGLVSGANGTRLQIEDLLDNGSGAIGSQHQLTIVAGRLINGGNIASATQAGGDPASDSTITIGGMVDNLDGGSLWADHDLTVTAGSIRNAGSIAASNIATLDAGSIDNGAPTGILGGGNRLALTFGSATVGKLALGNDLGLTATGDWTNAADQTITAPHDLTLAVAGKLSNAGTIGATHIAMITAGGDVDNRAGGVLKADLLTIGAAGALRNSGLINGGALTILNVGSLANSGRIYGDAVTITSGGDVSNTGSTAVIASRSDRLAIFTPGNVTNIDDGLIYSAAALVIAGHERDAGGAWGRARSLTNSSATIQAQGDGLLAADTIINTRTVFEVSTVPTSSSYVSLAPVSTGEHRRSSERYTETISDTEVQADSGPGLMLFGGNLAITADTVTNAHSTLSTARDLTIDAATVSNLALAKTETKTDVGIYYKEYHACGFLCFSRHWEYDGQDPLYRQNVAQQGTLVPSVIAAGGNSSISGVLQNLLLDADGNIVSSSSTLSNSPTAAGGNTADGFDGGGSASSVGGSAVGGKQSVLGGTAAAGSVGNAGGTERDAAIAGVSALASAGTVETGSAATLSGQLVTRVSLLTGDVGPATLQGSLVTLTTGGTAALGQLIGVPASVAAAFHIALGGLFSFAPAGLHYLIETDPAFTNERTFLSSDYFLDRLGYDPARVERRLGDAYYEQQLIGKQLTALTGTVRLAAYADSEDQYRALMDAGAEYAKRFGLALGVGLTPEQMASLTTDIVLLVDVTVQTPSGPQHALAPVVYLTAAHAGDVQNSGALIASGGTLTVRSPGSLTNTGVIRAVAGSDISAATTLTNGGLIAGGRVATISAGGDLVSNGGAFTGGNVTLASGGNMALGATSATSHTVTSYAGGGVLTDATVHTLTTVNASGSLTVIARGDLTSQGAQLSAGNKANVVVGGTADLGAINDSTSSLAWNKIKHGGTSTATVDETVRGTSLSGTNGVSVAAGVLDAGGRLALTGSTVNSANGAVALSGAGGVEIGAANELHGSDTRTYTASSGFLSSKSSSATDKVTTNVAVGSTVSGATVDVASTGGGIAVRGSNIVADGDVTLAARGPVSIATAETTSHEETATKVKKSGFSIGGGGLFLGVAKNSSNGTVDSVTNAGSLVGSSGGNVTVTSGDALTVTGSQIAAPGTVALSGRSITVANATDTVDTANHSRASSFGLSIGASAPVVSEAHTVADAGRIAGSSPSGRTAAVAAVAGGLAVKNGIDAANAIQSGTGGATLSASIGFSKSSASSAAHDETIVASDITGGNVALSARGGGAASTISVIGSDIAATGDPAAGNGNLTVGADGAIRLAAAAATDSSSGSNRSSGASLGVSVGVGTNGFGGPSVNAAFNTAHGNYSGTDVTNRSTTLSATGTTAIATPGALTLDGAQVGGRRIEVDAGSLDVVSRQDSSTYQSKNSSLGANVSVTFSGQVSGGLNVGKGKQNGTFASVADQAGFYAGDGGFGIRVAGATDLKGGTIASTADPSLNSLTTGSFSASDLRNNERYSASQTNLGVGIGANLGKSGNGNINTNGSGTPLPGVHTSLGTLSATPPVAMSASGSQASVTRSAVAPGTITLTGNDPVSAAAVAGVSRDTDTANAALTQRYTDAKRQEIAQGFQAAQMLTGEVGTFFANRAADQKAKSDQAEHEQAEFAAGYRLDAKGQPLRDQSGVAIPLTAAEQALYSGGKDQAGSIANLQQGASDLGRIYGAASPARLVASALSGAAGSNVTGGLGGLVQTTAANVLQSLAVTQVKRIADSLDTATGPRETVRAALQAVVGCAGQAAGGGSCGAAAVGASASVVTNYLLTTYLDPKNADGTPRTLEDQQARSDLVATIAGAIATGAGLNANSAVTSAQIETQNNDLVPVRLPNGKSFTVATPGDPRGTTVETQLGYTKGDPRRAGIDTLIQAYGLERFEDAPVALEKFLDFVVTLQGSNRAGEIPQDLAFVAAKFGDYNLLQTRVLADIAGGESPQSILNRYVVNEAAIRAAVPGDATADEIRSYTLSYMYGQLFGPAAFGDVVRDARLDSASKKGFVPYLKELFSGLSASDIAQGLALSQMIDNAVDGRADATGVTEEATEVEETAILAGRTLGGEARAVATITAGGRVTGSISALSVQEAEYVGGLVAAGKRVDLVSVAGADGSQAVHILADGVPTGRIVAAEASGASGAPAASTAAGSLTGRPTAIPPLSDAATSRALTLENQSASTLSSNGYNVTQNPVVNGPKNPDYLINGEIFDNYAPTTANVRNIASTIEGKVSSGQTDNLVVNLRDSTVSPAALESQLTRFPVAGLKQVIVIDRNGVVSKLTIKGH